MEKAKQLLLLIFALIICIEVVGQTSCREAYRLIHELSNNSYPILRDESISMTRRIRISKRLSKEALKLAYQTIQNNDCQEYGDYAIIVDRIIELEIKLGNYRIAEKIAQERLVKLYPNWKDPQTQYMNPDHVSALAMIKNASRLNGFYKNVRKNKGEYGVCGTMSDYERASILLLQAETLYDSYGVIYCLKFLENSDIYPYSSMEEVAPIWEKINNLLMKSRSDLIH